MFAKVLVANRGAVAARVVRALDEMRIASVAIYSDADANLPDLQCATETYRIGPTPARESYLNQDVLLDVLERSGGRCFASWIRVSFRRRAVRATRHRRGGVLHRAVASLDRFDGPQDTRARHCGAARDAEVAWVQRAFVGRNSDRDETRKPAIEKWIAALDAFELSGLKHNIPAILAVSRSEAFRSGEVHTGLMGQVVSKPPKHATSKARTAAVKM